MKSVTSALTPILLVWFAGTAAFGQTSHPDLSGMWEHSATSHIRGLWPQWTPEGQRQLAVDQQTRWHNGVSEENTYCLPAGMPFMMSGSEGFDIVQSGAEVAIINEERPSPRHIWLDRRKHPNPATYDTTTVGHSIGRWEGDTLVVDTTGFKAGATVMFVRSEQTHLTERYHLEDRGKKLRIEQIWTDPVLLAKPYTSVYLVERAPPGRDALEYYCDPRDPARAKP